MHKDLHQARVEDNFKWAALLADRSGMLYYLLKNRDVEKAQKVIDMDKEIDAIDHGIEENVCAFLRLQQPMARD